MSSLSPNLGFQLADGTDTFDNDKYIKGNFQYIDTNILPKTKTVQTNNVALKAELITLSFTTSGTANAVQANMTFANTYTNPPTVLPANTTAVVSGGDAISHPYIFGTTVSGCTAKLENSTGANFAAGTITMNFLVIGS